MSKISVSVIVVTKNEQPNIKRCLDALCDFSQVFVVDSNSTDKTCEIASSLGANVVHYEWDGGYPKKRGWCLENLPLQSDWVFFVDGDEVLTKALIDELRQIDFSAAGYFVSGRYIWLGKLLRFGLRNKKLCLFNRRYIEFPIINDLDLQGMGEIEGHYQPVLKADARVDKIGAIKNPLLHYACDDMAAWEARHKRYAVWEVGMNKKNAWPQDPIAWRQALKNIFRAMPFRGVVAFLHSYILKLGFLDGAQGLSFALSRKRYYKMIKDCAD